MDQGAGKDIHVRKVIRKRIRRKEGGVDLAADIDAVIATNVGESGSSEARSESHQRIVQRSGRSKANEADDRDERKRKEGP
jgi:hypothetical protein